MTNNTQIPSLAELRDDLLQKFTAETFCHLFLYTANPDLLPIAHEFAPVDGLNALVAKALEYAKEHDLLDALHREVERYDPSLHAFAAPVLTTPFNLPADLADFTGRQSEMDRVREVLSREGAVAISGIHGMGGIGKTALAVHVAHQLAAEGRFRDARLYIDLKGTDPTSLDPVAALQSLLSPLLGPDPRCPTNVDALAELWRRAIHGKDAVLILDNAAGAAQVRPLLPGCSTCAVLVTSRQRFTLPGAGILDLDPMDPGEARVLLQHLAPRLDEDGADAIAKLCGRLPLALRVAGNYLVLNDDVSAGRYAILLTDEKQRLARLRDPGDPDLDVEAAIALSVAQLDEEARRAWALLALFPVPFDLAATAALWKQSEESAALEQLQALRNRSLVAYDTGSGRYEQHDLLRLAAQRHMDVGAGGSRPSSAARERLARYYLAVAREVRDTQRYLDLDPDWPHLRAALEHAASASDVNLLSELVYALNHYWSTRSLAREWATWCQRAAVACAAAGRRRDEGAHLGNLGLAYAELGEVYTAIEYHQQALAVAREIGDRRVEGDALGNLGLAYYFLGELRTAIDYYDQALAILHEMGERRGEGQWLGKLAVAYADLGEVPKAIDYYDQALAIAREIGDRRNEGTHLNNLGIAYFILGQARKAIEHYEQALAIDREIGYRRGEAGRLGNLGNAYLTLGEARKAIEYYNQALAIDRDIGYQRGEGNLLTNLGSAYLSLGELRTAIEYHKQALAIHREIGDRRTEGAILGNLGDAYKDLGEARTAIAYCQQALAIVREIGDRRAEGDALGNLGLAYSGLGEARTGIDYCQQALAIAREIGDRRAEGDALGNLGLAYADLGEVCKAIDYHEQALAIARETGDRRNEGAWLGSLGLAYADLGEVCKAIDYHEQALAIAREIGDRRNEGAWLGGLGLAYADLGELRPDGDRPGAIRYYEQALAIAREIGDRRGEGNRLANLGTAYEILGDPGRARECWTQAFAIFEAIEAPNAEEVRRLLAELDE